MAAATAQNEVFVVTQYIPAANLSATQRGAPNNHALRFLQTFIEGEPKSLGIVQILIGFICLMCGIIQSFSRFIPVSANVGMPFVCALLFFISGGLSIAAEIKGTRSLVKGSLGMNILSAIVAGVEIILCSYDLSDNYSYYDSYICYYDCRYEGPSYYHAGCHLYRDAFISYQKGVLAILLLFVLLEFSIAIATSCFGCKSVRMPTSQEIAQPLFLAQNNYTQDPRVLPMQATGVPMAHGVTLMEDSAFGVTPISRLPQAHEGVQEISTAAPPPYYKVVHGDVRQL